MSKTNQRRDEARVQALRLREEQQRASRRQRNILIALIAVGLAVVGGAVFWILSQIPEAAVPPPDFSQSEDPLSEVTHPSTANEAGGIEVGVDGVAGSTEGAADDAVVVVVYADYMCPVCSSFEEINGPLLDGLRESGDVIVDYRPVSILDRTSLGSLYSTRSGAAAGLIAERAPAAFTTFNDLMFANQPAEGTAGLTDEEIAEIAREAGAPTDVADAISAGEHMIGDTAFSPWVAAATEQATRDFAPTEEGGNGFGTPTILVDGENLATIGVDWRVEGALAAAIEEARG